MQSKLTDQKRTNVAIRHTRRQNEPVKDKTRNPDHYKKQGISSEMGRISIEKRKVIGVHK